MTAPVVEKPGVVRVFIMSMVSSALVTCDPAFAVIVLLSVTVNAPLNDFPPRAKVALFNVTGRVKADERPEDASTL